MKFRATGCQVLVLGGSFLAGITFGHWQYGNSWLPPPTPRISFTDICDDPSKIGSPVIDDPLPAHLYQAIDVAEGDGAAAMAATAVVSMALPMGSAEWHLRNAFMTVRYKLTVHRRSLVGFVANCVYFGRASIGVSRAAPAYFGKPLSQITLAEAAMLAGLIKGPSSYDSRIRPKRAKQRRDFVLDQLCEHGKIAEAKLLAAKAEPVTPAKAGVQ